MLQVRNGTNFEGPFKKIKKVPKKFQQQQASKALVIQLVS